MRRIVLVDGENLTYGLRNLLGIRGHKAGREKLDDYDYAGMLHDLLSDKKPQKILWFGSRLRRYDQDQSIRKKSEAAISAQSYFVNNLKKQSIEFVKVGYLRARESEPCTKCGAKVWRLAEKGVDVGLAVQMLTDASKQTEIVLITADTDLLPAVNAAKKLGAKVMYVGYEHRPINALSRAADTTRLVTIPLARKYQHV